MRRRIKQGKLGKMKKEEFSLSRLISKRSTSRREFGPRRLTRIELGDRERDIEEAEILKA